MMIQTPEPLSDTIRPLAVRLNLLTLAGALALAASAPAETLLLEETFGTAAQNPAADPTTTTVLPWTYSGPGGANSSRLFNPVGVGSAFNSISWISVVDGSAITATVPMSALVGTDADDGSGNILEAASFQLSFVIAAETSDAGRSITASYGISPSAGSTTFVAGQNGDGSQILTSFLDTCSATGGSVGKTPARTFTIEFTTSGMTTSDSLDLTITYASDDGSSPFFIVDDVELLVNPDMIMAPTVVADLATVLSARGATLGGEVTDTGGEDPDVTIYYGTSNGGTDTGLWDANVAFGPEGGTFATTVLNLEPDTGYYFQIKAENSAGASWLVASETFSTNALTGITTELDSSSFAYQYELDENPSDVGLVDLDSNGTADWFPGVATGLIIPQTYTAGIAYSNQNPVIGTPDVESFTITMSGSDAILDWAFSADTSTVVNASEDLDGPFGFLANVPSGTTQYTDTDVLNLFGRQFYQLVPAELTGAAEILFRTDTGGSIQRENLLDSSFTIEAALRMVGPKDAGDVGVFAFAIDPGGSTSSLRVNIDLAEMSQNNAGDDLVATTDNSDAMHVYRIAYNRPDDSYWVWRDDTLIYAADLSTGIVGTNGGFNDGGSWFFGDFSSTISGEWEVDFIRVHNEAVAPVTLAE